MHLAFFLIGILSRSSVNALPQLIDDLFQDSSVDVSAIGVDGSMPPVLGNPSDIFYQSIDFDRPVDTSRFESPFDSSNYGLSKSPLELSGTSTPWIDAIGSAVSTGQSVPASQAGDVQLHFDGTEFLHTDYQVGQGDDKIAIVPESSLAVPFPDVPLPQILEPTCPAGKKAYCCSGGKAANNIGKGDGG